MKSDKGFACENVIRWGNGNLYSDPVCNPGETYSSSNGYYWSERSNNVCIKAFTLPDDDIELETVEISSNNFPDEIFRNYIRDFDLDDDGALTPHEISIIHSIYIPNSGLHSMKGIELLVNVVSIDVSNNCLRTLDLSANTAIESLNCKSQDTSGLVLTKSDDTFSVNLKSYILDDSSDFERLIPESVKISSGNVSYDNETGIATFSTLASWVRYEYDTGFNGITMDVTAHTIFEDEGFVNVNIDDINFPDAIFRDFVKQYDSDNDGWLSLYEISSVNKIILNDSGLSSLKGIEFFTNLEELYCYRNNLTALDVSSNSALKILHCSDNPIKSLDISNNVNLTKLYVYRCELEALDLRNNLKLDTLFCSGNHLTELELSNLPDLNGSLGYGAGYVEYDSQTLSALKVSYSEGKYSVNMKDYVSDISRVRPDTVRGVGVGGCVYDTDSGIATFSSKPSGLRYQYDTGYTKLENDKAGYRYMDVTVSAGKNPEILTSALPDAFINAQYEADIVVMCENTASLDIVSGDFPTGLRMEASGKISGIPSETGTFSFMLRAWNRHGEDKKILNIKISRKNPRISPNSLSSTTWGKKYAKTLRVSGLKSPMWSVSGDLPGGLSLNTSTGKISGIATGVGTFSFTAIARKGSIVSKNYSITVRGIKPKLTGSLPKGIVGTEYHAELSASGTTPITWGIPNLPKGLTFMTSDDGKLCIISGTPTEGFKRKVSVTLTSAAGSLTKNLTLRVNFTKPKITTPAIIEGKLGKYYFAKLEATGSPIITWKISSGTLPQGMTLSEDGTLYGIPGESGNFTFRAQAKNGGGKVSARFTLKISEAQNENAKSHDEAQEASPETSTYNETAGYYVIAAVLPEIEVDEEGMYEFEVALSDDVPNGELVWREFLDAEDSEDAIFLDDDGEVIREVSESGHVIVSAWLEPGKVYEPVIMVKQ